MALEIMSEENALEYVKRRSRVLTRQICVRYEILKLQKEMQGIENTLRQMDRELREEYTWVIKN